MGSDYSIPRSKAQSKEIGRVVLCPLGIIRWPHREHRFCARLPEGRMLDVGPANAARTRSVSCILPGAVTWPIARLLRPTAVSSVACGAAMSTDLPSRSQLLQYPSVKTSVQPACRCTLRPPTDTAQLLSSCHCLVRAALARGPQIWRCDALGPDTKGHLPEQASSQIKCPSKRGLLLMGTSSEAPKQAIFAL